MIGAIIVGLTAFSLLLQNCHPVDPRYRSEVQTLTRIAEIASATTALASDLALGGSPRATLLRLRDTKGDGVGLDDGNETNRGIETLFIALHLKGLAIRIDLPDDAIGNTDGDPLTSNPTQLDITGRLEILDGWGNPLAYFSAADYADPGAFSKIRMGEESGGEVAVAKPWKRKTGQFVNPRTFQVFSAGPDGIFNTEDDIGNWVYEP